jgi:hypothetical protein
VSKTTNFKNIWNELLWAKQGNRMFRYNRGAIIYSTYTALDATTFQSRYLTVKAELIRLKFVPTFYDDDDPDDPNAPSLTDFVISEEQNLDDRRTLLELIDYCKDTEDAGDITIVVRNFDEIKDSIEASRMCHDLAVSVLAIDRLDGSEYYVPPDPKDGLDDISSPIVQHFLDNRDSFKQTVKASDVAGRTTYHKDKSLSAERLAKKMYPEMEKACRKLRTSNVTDIIEELHNNGHTSATGRDITHKSIKRWAKNSNNRTDWKDLLSQFHHQHNLELEKRKQKEEM